MGLPPRHGAVAQPLTSCATPPVTVEPAPHPRCSPHSGVWKRPLSPPVSTRHRAGWWRANHLSHRGRHLLDLRRVRHGCTTRRTHLVYSDAAHCRGHSSAGRAVSGGLSAPSACGGGLSAFSGEQAGRERCCAQGSGCGCYAWLSCCAAHTSTRALWTCEARCSTHHAHARLCLHRTLTALDRPLHCAANAPVCVWARRR